MKKYKMGSRVKNIDEWLKSKEPQFSIYFWRLPDLVPTIVTRLSDGKQFELNSLFISENYGAYFIKYFHKDFIHVMIKHAKYGEKVTTRNVQINSL
jgi:hypothetical protein